MARARSGQTWSAERYARNSAFVVRFGEQLIDDLAPRPGERILDLGCGDGALTQKIIAHGAEVTGVDAGADMVAAARERGIDARVMDARSLDFDAVFDAVLPRGAALG
jgi:trans-aconitate methyltransferase